MTELSVLTLNCWGLKFVSKEREDRLTAIGRYLADTSRGYDIVGLQEVWVYDDFLRIRDLVRDTLPYAKHWYSGALGSGLVILSKYPIVGSTMRRFALNGDPMKIFHGDWYVGKCVVSAIIAHPTCGEIEVFNTHLHAGYDPVGTVDRYLGCRVGEAWEMSSLVTAAASQGRHVISLGDYNSAPNSLVVGLLTKRGGLTDSWAKVHPAPTNPVPSGLTPDEGVAIMGVTCDTPLNTWTKHTWINHHTNDAIGERLDYIFFRETPEFSCTHVDVAVREQISGIGAANSGSKNYSDHFGVHAKFIIKPAVYHFENRAGAMLSDPFSSSPAAPTTKSSAPDDMSVETLEEILLLLQQYSAMTLRGPKLELKVIVPLCIVAQIALIIGNFFVETRWVAGILTVLVGALGAGWMSHFLYAFLYGRETEGTYKNLIDEVQESLDRRTGQKSTGSRTSSHYQATGARNSLLQ
ncbi:MAG: Endonuclease/exonuclease/phosphatase [Podila humilis]|nr:MAG: Endonuclease/exonuclease/phosphatase [Podila humilis]